MRTLQVADALTNMRRCKKLSTMRMIGLVINPNKVIYSFFRHRFLFCIRTYDEYLSALDNSDFRKSNAKQLAVIGKETEILDVLERTAA
jgi:hypothetical protein